jgi:hypothetical protein
MCDMCPDLTEAEARANSAGSYALAIASLRADLLASPNGAIPARFPSAVQPCAADTARLSSRIAAVTLPRGEGRAALSSPTGERA